MEWIDFMETRNNVIILPVCQKIRSCLTVPTLFKITRLYRIDESRGVKMQWTIPLLMIFLGTIFGTIESQVTVSPHKTLLLPVNWDVDPKLNLAVKIPAGFKNLSSASELDENVSIIEYIPDQEDESSWTRRITVMKYVGKRFSAAMIASKLKSHILANIKNPTIWDETISTKQKYQQAFLGIEYHFQNRREVMGAQIYSGPYDCAGVQYSLRLPSAEGTATPLVEEFFKSNVQLISFTPN